MLGSSIPIENMSHLASSFPVRTGPDGDIEVESFHPTQMSKKRVKVTLLFVIPASDESSQEDSDQRTENLPRIASVRVPKGVPVAKVRPLIRHVEDQLQDIFGRSRRLNFVMTCDDGSENWTYSFDLPTFGVVYV